MTCKKLTLHAVFIGVALVVVVGSYQLVGHLQWWLQPVAWIAFAIGIVFIGLWVAFWALPPRLARTNSCLAITMKISWCERPLGTNWYFCAAHRRWMFWIIIWLVVAGVPGLLQCLSYFK